MLQTISQLGLLGFRTLDGLTCVRGRRFGGDALIGQTLLRLFGINPRAVGITSRSIGRRFRLGAPLIGRGKIGFRPFAAARFRLRVGDGFGFAR
jgi:hypothetical protein